jgi:hypothetical protein
MSYLSVTNTNTEICHMDRNREGETDFVAMIIPASVANIYDSDA